MPEFCSIEKANHVMTGTLERPDRLNALHPPANAELGEVFDDFAEDEEGEEEDEWEDEDEEENEAELVEGEKITLIPRPSGEPGLVEDAAELVLNSGRVSASFLQRRLRVDFDGAMQLLRALRVRGVIRIGDNETHGSLA